MSQSSRFTRAASEGITTAVIEHGTYPTREAFDDAMQAELQKHAIDYVCLAGFMRLLSRGFVEQWQGRMLNIHPSLLPEYKGLNTHARVLADGKLESGCTVHLVTPELDDGPTVLQERVLIELGDTPESLQQRVPNAEHRIYPEALRMLVKDGMKSPHAPSLPSSSG